MSWLFSSPGSVLLMPTCLQDAGVALDDLELADVAAELFQPLHGPGAQDAVEVAARDAVFALRGSARPRSSRTGPAGSRSPGVPLMA